MAGIAVAPGEAHLGEQGQRVRLARRRALRVVQLGGLGQLDAREAQEPGEQGGLAGEGVGEGDGSRPAVVVGAAVRASARAA